MNESQSRKRFRVPNATDWSIQFGNQNQFKLTTGDLSISAITFIGRCLNSDAESSNQCVVIGSNDARIVEQLNR